MPKVYVSAVIDAPIEQVWHKIRDFGGLAGWAPAIAASELKGGPGDRVGAERKLTLAGNGATVVERLLALDDTNHSLSYAIIEAPLPIANYVSQIRLRPVTVGKRTFAEWSGEFDVLEGGNPAELQGLFAEGVYGSGLAKLAEILSSRG
jgi:hypothetical protein